MRKLALAIGLSLTLLGVTACQNGFTDPSSASTSASSTGTTTGSEASIVESLGLTDIVLRESGNAVVGDFYTPAPIIQKIVEERAVNWREFTGVPGNLARFSFGEDGTTNLFLVEDTTTSVRASLGVTPDLAAARSVKADSLLLATFQFVEVDPGKYAIYSGKHTNYALDLGDDGTSLVLRDVRSLAAIRAGSSAFLTFSVGVTPLTLVANGRYTINTAESSANNTLAFDSDAGWTNRQVVLTGNSLTLATTGGTAMEIYQAPVQMNIPTDFNPEAVPRVPNKEYFDPNIAQPDQFAAGIGGLAAAYANQTAQAGEDPGTLAAAEAKLTEIEEALASQGSQTRYPKEFYLAVRQGMFQRVLQSAQSLDGEMGQHTIPYVYFTNEADAAGNFHPFMVVASRGTPDSLVLLGDVPRPPGDGLSGNFDSQNVTRSFFRKNFLLKFPLRDYGEVATLTENDLSSIGTLADDVGGVPYDHHNYADTGQSALAIDGVLIFPSYNNRLNFSQEEGEISARGLHAGRGLDTHYHADPHSATVSNANSDSGLDLYNESDYTGHNHPPIVSLGFDGVAGYGFYLDGDTTSEGAGVALDEFGGHEHGDYGYHYHALRTPRQTTRASVNYTTHELGPFGAWAGRINFVPEFQSREPRSVWLGNL